MKRVLVLICLLFVCLVLVTALEFIDYRVVTLQSCTLPTSFWGQLHWRHLTGAQWQARLFL